MPMLSILVLALFGALISDTKVNAVPGWQEGVPQIILDEPHPYDTGLYCPSFRSVISVVGVGDQGACVFTGSALSFAQYYSAGTFTAAVRFPFQPHFFVIEGVCEHLWGCIYLPEADRLVAIELRAGRATTVVYDEMSARVSFQPPFSFKFDAHDPWIPLEAVEGVVETPRIGASRNGKWIVVELKRRGIALIDTAARASAFVDVLGNMYDRGFNPSMELTVSDDGNIVVLVGRNVGVRIYEVNETCLRPLSDSQPVGGCPATDAGIGSMIPGFRSAHNPQLDPSGTSLRLQLVSQAQPPRMVVLQRPGGQEQIEYLALGDSFTSGEGEVEHSYYDPRTSRGANACHLSRRSYPFLLQLPRTQSVACAGATLQELLHAAQYPDTTAAFEYLPGTLPQADFLSYAQPKVATVGIGGNDAGFIDKLAACAAPGTCFWASEEGMKATAGELHRLAELLQAAFQELANRAPFTALFAVGYPNIVSEHGHCDVLTGLLFSSSERRFMHEALRYLNQIIEIAARRAGIGFIAIEDSYKGYELCSGARLSAMNGVRLGSDIAPIDSLPTVKVIGSGSFHPTPFGHRLTAEAIRSTYGDLRQVAWCGQEMRRCPSADLLPALPLGWGIPDEEAIYHRTAIIGSATSPDSLDLDVPPGWFAPASSVSATLHSTPMPLGHYAVDEKGRLRQAALLASGIEAGFHTLMLEGESLDGRRLILYQTVRIGYDETPVVVINAFPDTRGQAMSSTVHTIPSGTSSLSEGDDPPLILGAIAPTISQRSAWVIPVIIAAAIALAGLAITKRAVNAYNGTMANIRTIVKKLIPRNVFRQIEPYGHLGEAILANVRYGFPGRKLRVIGVTGTNGKTTTSFMIHRLLHESGIKVGLLTTVAYGIGDDIKPQVQHMTTVQAGVLQRRLRDFARQGVEWVVVETSSHALAQHRVWGVPYEIAVMTNITHEHLDYHGTFENYVEAKRRLFKLANKSGLRFGVVNAQDPSAEKFVKSVANHTTYGIGTGDLKAENVKLASDKSRYRAVVGDDSYDITVNIPGEFNVSNSLAAIAVGRKLGLKKAQIEKGIAALKGVEGRMNIIDEGQPFKVIVDFASTPDGFEKFFKSVRPLTRGKLITVFGSAGRRDEAKRPVQGDIAARSSDIVILTEEDDRDVDGNQILQEIAAGAMKAGKKEGKDLFLILNREEAIGFAMTQAQSKDDVVALLGKGHEHTIERADGEYPWNEADVARAALQALKKA